NFVVRPLNKMVDYIYNHSSKILTSSRSFKKTIEHRGIKGKKIEYWPQYAEELYTKRKRENNKVEVEKSYVPSFVFAGNLGEGQGLEILPKAAKKLKDQNLLIRFVLIGDGRDKDNLIRMIEKLNVTEYLTFIERQPAELIPYYLAKFDVGLIILNENEIFSRTIPAKLQSLMACGMPILLSANGEVQNIIREANNGLIGNAGNVEEFVENVKTFLKYDREEIDRLRLNSLNYNKKYFDKNKLMNQLVQIFEEEINCSKIKHY